MPRQMSQKRKESFLRAVTQNHGPAVADCCKTIMEQNPNISPLAIVQQALRQIMPDIDEKKLAEARFDSRPRLTRKKK